MMKMISKTGTLLVCLAGLTACASMNQPIGDTFGAAVENNRQAHIIDKGPPSSEQPYQTGSRAADAIERYESGESSDSSAEAGSSGMTPAGLQ